MEKIVEGQKLWYVPTDGRDKPHEITVGKVGRRWAETGYRLRIDVETLEADGGKYSSPGRCWITREAWQAEQSRQAAWSDLKEKMNRSWSAPDGVSIDAIHKARAFLGFT